MNLKNRKSVLFLIVALLLMGLILGACTPQAPAEEATEGAMQEPAISETEAGEPAAPEATEAVMVVEGATPVVLEMPKEIAGGRPVEIKVAEMPPDSQPVLRQNWLDQADRFMAMYPNVTIVGDEYTYLPDTFPPLVAANQVPTVFAAYLTEPGKMIDQGIAADLTEVYQANGLDKVFNPEIMTIASDANGHVYGIPREAYAMGLAYNIPMLKAAGYDAPPKTWDEALEMATKLTNRDEGIAGLSMITDGANPGGWHVTTIAYTFGLNQLDVVAPKDGGYVASFDNEAMLNTLNLIHDLRWKGDVLPRENLDWPRNGEALATEHAAMVVMAGQQFTWIRQTYADVDMSKFGFSPLPYGPNGQTASLVGGYVLMVSAQATDDQKEAASYYMLWTQLDPSEIKINLENSTEDPAVVVGAPMLPRFVGDFQDAYKTQDDEYANLPVENYKLFVDAVKAGEVKIIPEPVASAQEYYGIMGALASQIVTDEGVDIPAALKEALNNYQTNVLDQLAK